MSSTDRELNNKVVAWKADRLIASLEEYVLPLRGSKKIRVGPNALNEICANHAGAEQYLQFALSRNPALSRMA